MCTQHVHAAGKPVLPIPPLDAHPTPIASPNTDRQHTHTHRRYLEGRKPAKLSQRRDLALGYRCPSATKPSNRRTHVMRFSHRASWGSGARGLGLDPTPQNPAPHGANFHTPWGGGTRGASDHGLSTLLCTHIHIHAHSSITTIVMVAGPCSDMYTYQAATVNLTTSLRTSQCKAGEQALSTPCIHTHTHMHTPLYTHMHTHAVHSV